MRPKNIRFLQKYANIARRVTKQNARVTNAQIFCIQFNRIPSSVHLNVVIDPIRLDLR